MSFASLARNGRERTHVLGQRARRLDRGVVSQVGQDPPPHRVLPPVRAVQTCESVSVWAFECVSVLVCECVSVWVCECVSVSVSGPFRAVHLSHHKRPGDQVTRITQPVGWKRLIIFHGLGERICCPLNVRRVWGRSSELRRAWGWAQRGSHARCIYWIAREISASQVRYLLHKQGIYIYIYIYIYIDR